MTQNVINQQDVAALFASRFWSAARAASFKRAFRNVWSAAELQAKEGWQLVCINVFGLVGVKKLRAMMEIRSPSSL